MANRKYLFFADVAKQLGHNELAKLFRKTAAQETEQLAPICVYFTRNW